MNHLAALRAAGGLHRVRTRGRRAKSVIYIFLSGGLSQHESFDLKPDAPDDIRGEFQPIATRTPGIQICEHLPELAKRSHLWALVRSLTHPSNDHSLGHMIMLSGGSAMPPASMPVTPKADRLAVDRRGRRGVPRRGATTCRRPSCCPSGWSIVRAG